MSTGSAPPSPKACTPSGMKSHKWASLQQQGTWMGTGEGTPQEPTCAPSPQGTWMGMGTGEGTPPGAHLCPLPTLTAAWTPCGDTEARGRGSVLPRGNPPGPPHHSAGWARTLCQDPAELGEQEQDAEAGDALAAMVLLCPSVLHLGLRGLGPPGRRRPAHPWGRGSGRGRGLCRDGPRGRGQCGWGQVWAGLRTWQSSDGGTGAQRSGRGSGRGAGPKRTCAPGGWRKHQAVSQQPVE